MNNFKAHILTQIESCPTLPLNYEELIQDRNNPYYRNIVSWLKRNACLAANMIHRYPEIWEPRLNWPVDVFLASPALPGTQAIRELFERILKQLIALYKKVLFEAEQRMGEPHIKEIFSAKQWEFPVRRMLLIDDNMTRLKWLKIIVSALETEGFVTIDDYLFDNQHTLDPYLNRPSDSECSAKKQYLRFAEVSVIDPMSRRVIQRIRKLVDELQHFLRLLGTQFHYRPQIRGVLSDISCLEGDLGSNEEAIEANPYINLGQLYFKYYEKPDYNIIHHISGGGFEEEFISAVMPFERRVELELPSHINESLRFIQHEIEQKEDTICSKVLEQPAVSRSESGSTTDFDQEQGMKCSTNSHSTPDLASVRSESPHIEISLDETRLILKINQKPYDLTDEGLKLFKKLIEAKGVWVGGKNIGNPRPDKVIDRQELAVQDLIDRGKSGYRLKYHVRVTSA